MRYALLPQSSLFSAMGPEELRALAPTTVRNTQVTGEYLEDVFFIQAPPNLCEGFVNA